MSGDLKEPLISKVVDDTKPLAAKLVKRCTWAGVVLLLAGVLMSIADIKYWGMATLEFGILLQVVGLKLQGTHEVGPVFWMALGGTGVAILQQYLALITSDSNQSAQILSMMGVVILMFGTAATGVGFKADATWANKSMWLGTVMMWGSAPAFTVLEYLDNSETFVDFICLVLCVAGIGLVLGGEAIGRYIKTREEEKRKAAEEAAKLAKEEEEAAKAQQKDSSAAKEAPATAKEEGAASTDTASKGFFGSLLAGLQPVEAPAAPEPDIEAPAPKKEAAPAPAPESTEDKAPPQAVLKSFFGALTGQAASADAPQVAAAAAPETPPRQESKPAPTPAKSAAPKEFKSGDKLKILSPTGNERAVTCIETDDSRIKVHFEGYEDKFDEWLPKDSQRIISKETPVAPPAASVGGSFIENFFKPRKELEEVAPPKPAEAPAAKEGAEEASPTAPASNWRTWVPDATKVEGSA